jgi:hypothetical protein
MTPYISDAIPQRDGIAMRLLKPMRKLIFITALFLTSCGEMQEERKVTGNYYMAAVDGEYQMALTYKATDPNSHNYAIVVDNCVFAAGYNDKYTVLSG